MMRSTALLVLVICSVAQISIAQCYDQDWHNTSLTDIWLSCQKQESPIPQMPAAHWIQYELDEPTSISQIKLWNITNPDHSNLAANEVRIDYSMDGSNWTLWTTQQMSANPDPRSYTGEEIRDLEAFTARYILLTITDARDSKCSGLAEVKFVLGEATTPTEDLQQEALSIYPNPADTKISVDLQLENVSRGIYTLYDVAGTEVLRKTDGTSTEISVSHLVEGTYLLKARFDNEVYTQKVIITHP